MTEADFTPTTSETPSTSSMWKRAVLLVSSLITKRVESSLIIFLVLFIGMIIFRHFFIEFSRFRYMVINVTTIILSFAYIAVKEITVGEFARMFFVLHLPIILYSLGFVLNLYQSLDAMLFLSLTTTILQAEIKTMNDPYVIFIYSLFAFYYLLVYKRKSRPKEIILYYEEKFEIGIHRGFAVIIFLIDFALIIFLKEKLDILLYIVLQLAFSFFPAILIAIINVYIFEYLFDYINILLPKLFVSSGAIIGCISIYIKNNNVISIIYLSFIIITPMLYKYRFIAKNEALEHENVHYMNDGDLYRIDWIKGTASYVRKGNQNNIIRRYIQCEGKNIKVVSLEQELFKNYLLSSLAVQFNIFIMDYMLWNSYCLEPSTSFILDDDFIWNIKSLNYFNSRKNPRIEVTSRCKRLVSHNNFILSRFKYNILFCHRNVRKVFLNESLRIIKISAFDSCLLLKSIKIPPSVAIIENSAFSGCKSLSKVVFHEKSKLESIGKYSFRDTALVDIKLPSSLRYLGNYAFNSCRKLQKIVFPRKTEMKRLL